MRRGAFCGLDELLPPVARCGRTRRQRIGVGRRLTRSWSPFSITSHKVLPSVALLSATYRLGWDTKTKGLCMAFVGVASGIVQGELIQPSIRWMGEHRRLLAGMLSGAAGFAVTGPDGDAILGRHPAHAPVGALWGPCGGWLIALLLAAAGVAWYATRSSPSQVG
jgi:hypothetical protein